VAMKTMFFITILVRKREYRKVCKHIQLTFFFFLHQKGKPVLTGAVRVSFGSTSLPSDVDKVLQFL
jgi:hypothetical protein